MKTKILKKTTLLFLLVIFCNVSINGQSFEPIDKAPHDISYLRTNRATKPIVKVIYGRPQKAEPVVFGNQVPFNKIWRTGANEATEVKFYKDVVFGGVVVPEGTYVLYTIPGEQEWEVILSSNVDVLGAFEYNPAFDVARISVPVSKAEELESFSIAFKTKNDFTQMVLGWDTTRIKIPLVIESQEGLAKL
ncbi:DUF2911 domain-containing protein [Aureibaculum sp. 2210JD6-5]|uniref:DUF2911 domain-containing protein n=1 Tax=Aureibaculum sp. 2210JD6-5 TaxID=3103957 RepID=UPI002AAD83AF|nr:DUF2911 domain-containing protein [Aureibaculum sp. 2210JD6-5]MDY7394060.1 DUF2911 domain-containing protein [Aureibaculum sp. 2210JD6-5]